MAGDEFAPHMYALRAGTLLHEFRIEAVLGHGGFGITYKAFDTSLHKAVAIKEYLPNELASRVSDSTVRARSPDDQQQFEQGVAAFLDEARLVARLRHRNIMEVLRFFKLNGTGYIVLRNEQGRTLKRRLDDGPLSEGELRHVLGGLLDGIEVLHNEAILHRDIKPSNIILSDSRIPGERGVPVLIDFGAASYFGRRHSLTTALAPYYGSLGYAPPEQHGIGEQVGPWSDLYALGATAYRCVTGQRPPEAPRRLRKDPYVPAVEAAVGRYDEGLLDLIDQMLSVEEVDRPQSAAEVREALRSRKDRGTVMADNKSTPHMFALRPGTLLHEFRIDAVLGHGGFAITYKAFDTDLYKAVAIKEYLPNELAARDSDSTVRAKSTDDQQQFEDGVAAFLDEARLIARLQHKNLMEVLRFFKLNGTGYIVLGYEEGRTLKQRLDDGPLAEAELRHVLGGLLDGIEVLHNEAILHRDIKPSNIILSDSRIPGERGVWVLIGFGTARDFRSWHSRTTIVASGYASLGYAPPEQYWIGGQAGPWSDLYALGATAYRCVTGQVPPEALRRLRKDPYVPAVEAAAGRYDEGLLALIDQMLSVDEVDRPQSAAEVREALLVAQGLGGGDGRA